jgi:hypothetical protein
VYLLDMNGVKLNGACTIAALLYGKGDFVETLQHAFNFGWDADNNAATAGTIIGVTKGYKWMMDQGWKIQDKFRNTSRDELPDESITRYGDRLIALAGQNIREQGGQAPANGKGEYRIVTQPAANLEKLANAGQQLAALRREWAAQIEAGVRRPESTQHAARAAYLAIALDTATGLSAKYPDGWRNALAALSGYPGVMQALFYESAGDAGEPLRQRALAAGLVAPPKNAKK